MAINMENEKPFKTIEVIDSRTNQVCKVACMSCIRGHRTMSCGIPVCRNKVFWTVKRPGRPSNSCTCRYGATRGCKCVVAKSACPHKSKKGERKSGECKCDQQGRYCCLLDPSHWTVLMSLQKPTVDFYPDQEALNARHALPTATTLPGTPLHSTNSPQPFASLPGTPGPPSIIQPFQGFSSPPQNLQSTPLTPRFGMMGIGAPQGSEGAITPDVFSWQGKAPEAPRQYHSMQHEQFQEQRSCCKSTTSPQPSEQYPQYTPLPQFSDLLPQQPAAAFGNVMQTMSMPEPQPSTAPSFDFNKLSDDYFTYQLPSAICQTCGLNGCTCRNCPPVMQNFSTGSWAQCCGRKHARTAAYVPTQARAAFSVPKAEPIDSETVQFQGEANQQGIQQSLPQPELQAPSSGIDFSSFGIDQDFSMPADTNELDLDDFLLPELERPPEGGCCCGDP